MSIINLVICYNNEEEVINYALECSKQTYAANIVLIITVNSSNYKDISKFEKKLNDIPYIEVKMYHSKQNLGYLNGMLYGYRKYLQEDRTRNDFEWVIMSNTDIKYPMIGMLEEFANAHYESNIWCVAPSVFNLSNKSYGNPHYTKKLSKEKIKRNIFIFSHFVFAYVYFIISSIKTKQQKSKKLSGQYVYAVHGCYFFLKRSFVDYLLTQTFTPLMYSEEAYIAEKLERLDKLSYYDANLEVEHMESTVTGKLKVKKKSQYFAESLRFILDEFY